MYNAPRRVSQSSQQMKLRDDNGNEDHNISEWIKRRETNYARAVIGSVGCLVAQTLEWGNEMKENCNCTFVHGLSKHYIRTAHIFHSSRMRKTFYVHLENNFNCYKLVKSSSATAIMTLFWFRVCRRCRHSIQYIKCVEFRTFWTLLRHLQCDARVHLYPS